MVVWRGSCVFIPFEEVGRKLNHDYRTTDGVVHRGLYGSRRGQDIEAAADDDEDFVIVRNIDVEEL